MGDKSHIEWTDATWNPVRGCSLVSAGCTNCYAMKTAHRHNGKGRPYEGLTRLTEHGPVWTGAVRLVPELLDLPLRWKKPRRIFVNSMSDLFHEKVPDEFIISIYAHAIAAVHLRGHVLQILTKRAQRMRDLLNSEEFWDAVNAEAGALVMERTDPLSRRSDDARATLDEYGPDNPPPGIHLGVSVEDQLTFDERWQFLRDTPAAVRFLSYEPALGPLDADEAMPTNKHDAHKQGLLDWVICGGESGPGAWPMHPDWARSLRDQCTAAGVPFFFKQWGEYGADRPSTWPADAEFNSKHLLTVHRDQAQWPQQDVTMFRVGKKAAGRILDGRTWDEYPCPEQSRRAEARL